VWPWLGLLLAVALLAPNLVWQQLNGWPTLDFLRAHNAVIESSGERTLALNFDSGGVFAFLAFQPVLIGVLTLPVWLMGGWICIWRANTRAAGLAGVRFARSTQRAVAQDRTLERVQILGYAVTELA
jgi:hypothetical protein